MLVLPLTRKAAHQNEGSRLVERLANERVSRDQEPDAFNGGKTPDVKKHWPFSERRQFVGHIGHSARLAIWMPAKWMLYEQLPPEGYAVNLMPIKYDRIKAIGNDYAALRIDCHQIRQAFNLRLRQYHESLACTRPLAHPLCPRFGICPAHGRSLSNCLEHQQFCPMYVSNHRNMRGYTCRCFVERSEVIEGENIGLSRTCMAHCSHPGRHELLVDFVVDC